MSSRSQSLVIKNFERDIKEVDDYIKKIDFNKVILNTFVSALRKLDKNKRERLNKNIYIDFINYLIAGIEDQDIDLDLFL